jgi:glutamine synthetase
MGMTELLPKTLEEALDIFEKNREWLSGALGKEYVDWFLVLKRHELKTASGMETDARRLKMIDHF